MFKNGKFRLNFTFKKIPINDHKCPQKKTLKHQIKKRKKTFR